MSRGWELQGKKIIYADAEEIPRGRPLRNLHADPEVFFTIIAAYHTAIDNGRHYMAMF
jgi:hypothetical protein